jgi:hypothetical protein
MRCRNCFRDDPEGAQRSFRYFARHSAIRDLAITDYHNYAVTSSAARRDCRRFRSGGGGVDERRQSRRVVVVVVVVVVNVIVVVVVVVRLPSKLLDISIVPASMPTLARTIPALRHLTVQARPATSASQCPAADWPADAGPMRPDVFPAIGSLTALRCLNVVSLYRAQVTPGRLARAAASGTAATGA